MHTVPLISMRYRQDWSSCGELTSTWNCVFDRTNSNDGLGTNRVDGQVAPMLLYPHHITDLELVIYYYHRHYNEKSCDKSDVDLESIPKSPLALL